MGDEEDEETLFEEMDARQLAAKNSLGDVLHS
jgi:hypothetical protein